MGTYKRSALTTREYGILVLVRISHVLIYTLLEMFSGKGHHRYKIVSPHITHLTSYLHTLHTLG